MVQPVIVPQKYTLLETDPLTGNTVSVLDPNVHLKVKCDRSGAVRLVSGQVAVPNGTAAGSIVGLVPFTKGARFLISDKMVNTSVNGTQNLGVVYTETAQGTDDLTLIASASATGFVVIDEVKGLDYVTTGNGWLVIQNVATASGDGLVKYSLGVSYDIPEL